MSSTAAVPQEAQHMLPAATATSSSASVLIFYYYYVAPS
jgi:hypothetical protein